jgi:hypothetical protein
MVQIAGVMTGIFLIGVVWAVYWLRSNETDPRLHGGRAFSVCLGISSAAIALLGLYSLANVIGIV